MLPQKGWLYYFKVEVAETPGQFLTIATTRPETIPGDTGIAVNPKDPRYAALVGKHVLRPLPPELPREQRLIPIVADEHIDPEFGTGVLKVTPAHDKADFEIGQRHGLAVVDVMHPNGVMNDLAGSQLRGLDRFEARKLAVEQLRHAGALVKEEPYENKVGFSQRAKVPIEPRLSEQWFLKYPSVEQARACVAQRNEAKQRPWRVRWPKWPGTAIQLSRCPPLPQRHWDPRRCVSIRNAGPRFMSIGWKISRTGALAASSGGDTGSRFGIASRTRLRGPRRFTATSIRRPIRRIGSRIRTFWIPGSVPGCGRLPPWAGRKRLQH